MKQKKIIELEHDFNHLDDSLNNFIMSELGNLYGYLNYTYNHYSELPINYMEAVNYLTAAFFARKNTTDNEARKYYYNQYYNNFLKSIALPLLENLLIFEYSENTDLGELWINDEIFLFSEPDLAKAIIFTLLLIELREITTNFNPFLTNSMVAELKNLINSNNFTDLFYDPESRAIGVAYAEVYMSSCECTILKFNFESIKRIIAAECLFSKNLGALAKLADITNLGYIRRSTYSKNRKSITIIGQIDEDLEIDDIEI